MRGAVLHRFYCIQRHRSNLNLVLLDTSAASIITGLCPYAINIKMACAGSYGLAYGLVLLYIHCLCKTAAKAQVSMRICPDLPEPSLLTSIMTTAVMPTKSDSDVIFCLQVLSKI